MWSVSFFKQYAHHNKLYIDFVLSKQKALKINFFFSLIYK